MTSVVTITGVGRSFLGSGPRAWLLRTLYLTIFRVTAELSVAVLFQNVSDLDVLRRRLPRRLRAKLHLVGSGIDTTFFDAVPAADRRRPGSLAVLRLVPLKGIDDLLEVARSLASLGPHEIVGPDSPSHPECLTAVRAAEDAGQVTYAGEISSAAVRERLRDTSVLLLPSYSEGLPRIAVEAVLSGAAVAAYDIPGCRAALGPDYPLVEVGDVAAFTAAARRLLEDDDHRRAILATGRAFVDAELTATAYLTRLRAVLVGAAPGLVEEDRQRLA